MRSPLEDYPNILGRIGLFIVLFNGIDAMLNNELYFITNQEGGKKKPILDNLLSQDFSKRLDMLRIILGDTLYFKIKNINEFRNFITHGTYGLNSIKGISISKMKRYTGKYHSKSLNEEIINKHIDNEREAMDSLYEIVLGVVSKIKKFKN